MVICRIVLSLARVFLEINVTVVSRITIHQHQLALPFLEECYILESHWSWVWSGAFVGQWNMSRSNIGLLQSAAERAHACFLTPLFPLPWGLGIFRWQLLAQPGYCSEDNVDHSLRPHATDLKHELEMSLCGYKPLRLRTGFFFVAADPSLSSLTQQPCPLRAHSVWVSMWCLCLYIQLRLALSWEYMRAGHRAKPRSPPFQGEMGAPAVGSIVSRYPSALSPFGVWLSWVVSFLGSPTSGNWWR